jgi:hypothetical protein
MTETKYQVNGRVTESNANVNGQVKESTDNHKTDG